MTRLLLVLLFCINTYAAEKLSILIPLYSDPTLWKQEIEKIQTIKDKNIETYAIINPASGPGKEPLDKYLEGIILLKEHNIHVIGYVSTVYGKRDPIAVNTDVYKWAEFYFEFGVEGIFFDETSNKKEALEFYTTATNYAKHHGFNFNILNPGYTTEESFVTNKIASAIVTYENSYENFLNNFPTTINQPNEVTRLSLMLHHVNEEQFAPAIELAKERGFQYIYLTEDGQENPWDTISNFLLQHF